MLSPRYNIFLGDNFRIIIYILYKEKFLFLFLKIVGKQESHHHEAHEPNN